MNANGSNSLRQLAAMDGEYVVSIYLPVTVGAESRQNPVRFKNLVRAAASQMRERGIGEPAIQKMSVTARTLLDQHDLWQELSHGLAVFVSRDAFHVRPLPFVCDEMCHVGQHAFVLPILAWTSSDLPYFLLAVSQNAVRLLAGTRAGLKDVILPYLPANLATALNYDPRREIRQVHTGATGLGGKESAVFHGQGGEVDVAKLELTNYFRQIDRAVAGYLKLRKEPLVFAGVDYLFPLYQAVNSYANLVPTPLAGNPELLNTAALADRAWPLVEAAAHERRRGEAERYWTSANHGRTTNRLDEILTAATAGAVETLFIAPGTRIVGRFEAATATVERQSTPQLESEDLVNLSAILVLRTGGNVEMALAAGVPGGGVMAAVLRYPFTPIISTPINHLNGAMSAF